jgi:dTDP-4-dehydrorhamnose 3,5-epimerase
VKVVPTKLAGVVIAETMPFTDHRGSFARFFCERELGPAVGSRHIVQINHSRTAAPGAVRGLHYQRPPHGEMKLVRCIKGSVFDVAVDIRAGSPTFLQWHAEELSAENARMMIVPEGFAHGYQAIEADSELIYCTTAFYEPSAEGGLSAQDPRLGIKWPLPVVDLSKKDAAQPMLTPDFAGLTL